MKLTTSKLLLGRALKDAAKAVSPKNPIPVLAGIKFTADKDVILTGSDLELTIKRNVAAEIEETGSVILPVKIVELIDKLPSGTITIEADNTSATIKYGSSVAVMNGFDEKEYPELPVSSGEISFEIAGETLKDAIARVAIFAANEHPNAMLTGVLFDINSNTLTVAATDAYRLGYSTVELSTEPGDTQVIVPKKSVVEAMRLIKATDKVSITIGGNVIAFEAEGLSITTRLIGGNYPNYKAVVPTGIKTRVKIVTAQLLQSSERAALVNTGDTPIVTLECTGENIVVSQNNECGKLREEIPVETEGENFIVRLNAKYLAEMLKCTFAEKIRLDFVDSLKPLIITPDDDTSSIAVILPVRMVEKKAA